MTQSLRIAVLFEYAALNGGEYSWLATLPAIRAANIEVVAIAPTEGPLPDQLREKGITVHDWKTAKSGSRIPQPMLREQLAEILAEIHRRDELNLVHANSLAMSRLLGPVAHERGIRSLGHIRDIIGLSKKAVADVNQIDRLLAVSHATREWHVNQGIDAARIEVQYNGVDVERFAPSAQQGRGAIHQDLGIPPTTRLVGNVGQLGLRKGTEKFLESALAIADDFPDVHWVLAGERHSQKEEAIAFESKLHRLASSPPLKGRVHFVGRVANMASWMADLTVLMHTARQEPLGRVLLEGCAMGLPIVATDAGGTREILENAGRIVPIDDVTAMSAALRELLSATALDAQNSDLDDCDALGRRARERALSAFDSRIRGPQLIKHYQSLAAEA